MLPPSTDRSRFNGMILLAAIAPLLYYASIVAFSVNVPVGDDYAMLGFLNEFQAASGLGAKLQLLFSFHNEHRIVITRAIMLIVTTLTGAIDFRVLILIGNFAFLLALVVIGSMLRLRDDRLKWALLFLITLQLQPLKLMFYPMAGVQAYFGLLFSFLYLHFCLKDSTWWYATLLFYVLAILTTGSGIFLVIPGVMIVLYKKYYGKAVIHAAFAILVVLLYSPSSSNMPYLLEHPMNVAKFALLLLGSVAQLPMMGSPYLQIGFSTLLIGYFAFLIGKGFCRTSTRSAKENLATLSCMLYLLMIICLIAIGRASIYERDLWGASLDGRYRIYSILFFALCCIDFVGRLRERNRHAPKYSTGLITVALLFNLVWFVPSVISMRFDSVRRERSMQQWLVTRDASVLPLWSTPPGDAETNLKTAIKAGVYRP
jgi:hypothetical protein